MREEKGIGIDMKKILDIKIEPIFIIAIFMISGILISYFITIPAAVSFAGIIILFLFWKFSDSSKKVFFIYGLFLLISCLEYSLFVITPDLIKGKEYEIKGFVNGKRIEMQEIEGKIPREKIYVYTKGSNIENGNYTLKLKINEIKKIGERVIYQGEIVDYKVTMANKMRNYIRNKILDISYRYSGETYGFLKASLIGENDYIDKELDKMFKYTGTAHIIVISGGHIAVIIMLIMVLSNIAYIPYTARYLIVAAILSLYMFVLGWNESIARAYIMGIVYICGKIFFQKIDIKKAMAISVIATIIASPVAIFSVSFQLSYGAVVGLVFIYPMLKKDNDNIITEIIKGSFAVQIVLTPIFMYYFNQIPVFSFLTNIIAVPIGGIIIQTAFTALVVSMIFPALNLFLGFVLEWLIKIFYFFVHVGNSLPLLQVNYYEKTTLLSVFVFYAALIYIFAVKNEKMIFRIIVSVLVFVISLNINFDRIPNRYEGDRIIFIRNQRENIAVINKNLETKDIIEMKKSGVREIDYVFCARESNAKLIKKIYSGVKIYTLREYQYGDVAGIKLYNSGDAIEILK